MKSKRLTTHDHAPLNMITPRSYDPRGRLGCERQRLRPRTRTKQYLVARVPKRNIGFEVRVRNVAWRNHVVRRERHEKR